MLTQERFTAILDLLQEKKAVTVTELTKLLNTSESTIRRDLNSLDHLGRLKKVHGGATLPDHDFTAEEDDVSTKALMNTAEKDCVARYAAGLIQNEDFVYLDAGTTTERMIDYIENTKAVFVTNGIMHAKKLLQKGIKVYALGGLLKPATEAMIGADSLNNLKKYNFTKCFLGTNGIHKERGFSTPDIEEAMVKKEAVKRSHTKYVLADHTKFGKIAAVTFLDLDQACIITDKLTDNKYSDYTVIKEVL